MVFFATETDVCRNSGDMYEYTDWTSRGNWHSRQNMDLSSYKGIAVLEAGRY